MSAVRQCSQITTNDARKTKAFRNGIAILIRILMHPVSLLKHYIQYHCYHHVRT
jgi:hypothetical protein